VRRLSSEMMQHRESYTGEADSFIPRAIVHRLDKGTTGVLLLARSPEAEAGLTAQFKKRSLKKRYIALLLGHPGGDARNSEVSIEEPIGNDPNRPGKYVVSPSGKWAHSVIHLHAYDEEQDVSLVSVELHTGRPHQIRIHCAHLGAPVANDDDYADRTLIEAFRKRHKGLPKKRPLLHDWRMEFSHPVTGTPLTALAALPPDMASVVARLWPKVSTSNLSSLVAVQPPAAASASSAASSYSSWRVLLRGLPFSTTVEDVVAFLKPKMKVSANSVEVPKKNKKLRALKMGDLRPGQAAVTIEASAAEIERVRELHESDLGGRYIEVTAEPAIAS